MRLIDADALLKSIGYNFRDCSIGAEHIIGAQAIDAQPVIHAKWIGEVVFDGDERYAHASKECSNCHKVRTIDNFCSNCGAKMDLD